MKTFDFEVETLEDGKLVRRKYADVDQLNEDFDFTGWSEEGRLRPELVDMPILSGALGPMFGGFSNNGSHYTVRYESQAAYNVLSN